MRHKILVLAGILAILIGLLWVAQGLDLLNWPPQSFMIADREWALRGALLAGVGAILVAAMRRR